MMTSPLDRPLTDDPRRLRALLERAYELATQHSLRSVMVGLAGFEGDRVFPELVDYVVSALRIDDAVFRMTRERAVVLLSDADGGRADDVMRRVIEDFRERFPSPERPAISLGFYEIGPTIQAVENREDPRRFSTDL